MNPEAIGKLLIITGLVLVVIGALFIFTKFIPMGRLPGDIYIKKDNFSFYFPLATSIIISIILTLISFFLGKK